MVDCDPKDVALKALFLGPQAENANWLELQGKKIFQHWVNWRRSRFPQDGNAISLLDQKSKLFCQRQDDTAKHLDQLLGMLEKESPKFTPRFLGHMLSELSLPSILGHVAVLLHNPNQTSREVSQVSSDLEAEAIADLLAMVGMNAKDGRGHFTSGGTLANFEALWRVLYRLDRTLALALYINKVEKKSDFSVPHSWEWFEKNLREYNVNEAELLSYSLLNLGHAEFTQVYQQVTGSVFRSPLIFAPVSRHYSWPKAAALLGLGASSLRDIALDAKGRLSLSALAAAFAQADQEERLVIMVVSVAGATGTGAVDPVEGVQDFLNQRKKQTNGDVWHHVDAAYGGYFCTLVESRAETVSVLSSEVEAAFKAIGRAHSVTIDPHKLGFVPYSCGAFLAKDNVHYRSQSFAAPYLLTNNQGSWVHTIEGSRAGTGVAATWMANRSVGLTRDGYGRILEKAVLAAREVEQILLAHKKDIMLLALTDLNIVCLSLARVGDSLSDCNRRTLDCFERFRESPNFSVSKTEIICRMYPELSQNLLNEKKIICDDEKIIFIRLVLMNPFFLTRESSTSYVSEFVNELLKHSQSIF